MLNEYRRCAAICAAIDHSDRRTVKANNRAVTEMYKIVRTAARSGPVAILELAQLLDEPMCGYWLSHQILECCQVPPDLEKRCLGIISELAKDSLGDQIWLREYHSLKSRA